MTMAHIYLLIQVLGGSSSSSACPTEEITMLSTEHGRGRQLAHKKMNNTATRTRLSDLEQENTRLQARQGVLSKQTEAAHTVAPVVVLACQFLGNTQKVEGIQKSLTTLTKPAQTPRHIGRLCGLGQTVAPTAVTWRNLLQYDGENVIKLWTYTLVLNDRQEQNSILSFWYERGQNACDAL